MTNSMHCNLIFFLIKTRINNYVKYMINDRRNLWNRAENRGDCNEKGAKMTSVLLDPTEESDEFAFTRGEDTEICLLVSKLQIE